MLNIAKLKRAAILSGKIALGSSLAIYTAELLHLEFPSSAGIVTLLTLVTTKKGTLKLSAARIITFLMAAGIASITFLPLQCEWFAYGIFVFLVALISEVMGWRATLSTNAVIGTHFLMNKNFSPEFFLNELLLVLIGIFFAFILNMFQNVQGEKKKFSGKIRLIEQKMQGIIEEIAK